MKMLCRKNADTNVKRILQKIYEVAIRSTYLIFTKRNSEWTNPDNLKFHYACCNDTHWPLPRQFQLQMAVMELRHCNVYSCYMLKFYDEHYPIWQFGNESQRNNFGAAPTRYCPGFFSDFLGGLPSRNSLCVNKQSYLAMAKFGTYCYVRNMAIYIFMFQLCKFMFYSTNITEV